MVAEELPNEFAEIVTNLHVKLRLTLISFAKLLPIGFLIVFVYVLVKDISLICFLIERHHTCYHYEKYYAQCKDISGITFVGFAFQDLWGHVAFSPTMGVKDSNHGTFSYCFGQSEIANFQVKHGIYQNVLKFEISMNNFLLKVQIFNHREQLVEVNS